MTDNGGMDAAERATGEVAERYRRFARDEAPGRSVLYAEWAAGVAGDRRVCGILSRIPATHRQPPLVFAVARLLGAAEGGYAGFARWVDVHADALVAECSARSLQTNEPLRCAALLPALGAIAGPIALLEVGASAGLCLHPDRYSYRYDGRPDLDPEGGASPVVLRAALTGAPPVRMPTVAWRAGIDLAPLNAADPTDRRFLQSLVWPGETGRAARIRAALEVAAADPAPIVRGDATDPGVLAALAARAPSDATLVITTPGVLPHIDRAGRSRLLTAIRRSGAVWISLDPPGLGLEGVDPVDAGGWGPGFVLRRDGRVLAAADPLGAWVSWRSD